jgi:hypothetical protein
VINLFHLLSSSDLVQDAGLFRVPKPAWAPIRNYFTDAIKSPAEVQVSSRAVLGFAVQSSQFSIFLAASHSSKMQSQISELHSNYNARPWLCQLTRVTVSHVQIFSSQ